MFDVSSRTPTLRCPTCGANQAWSDTCRRCRCDLSLVHRALRTVRRYRRRCLENLRDHRYDRAARDARLCCRLDASPENRHLLAITEFLRGHFHHAVQLARLDTPPSSPNRWR